MEMEMEMEIEGEEQEDGRDDHHNDDINSCMTVPRETQVISLLRSQNHRKPSTGYFEFNMTQRRCVTHVHLRTDA
eukprot:751167-Hanusia_phi.AAC.1